MAALARRVVFTLLRSLVPSAVAVTLAAGSAGAFTFTQIDVPGAVYTAASGINRQGQIVGSYARLDEEVSHGFLLDQGSFTTIDFPGAVDTAPTAITGRGKILGFYTKAGPTTTSHGFLLRRGAFARVDVPGAIETGPTDMNGRGQIVGWYEDSAFGLHGFLLQEGVFTTIDVPGAVDTGAGGVNGRGQIVGVYCVVTGEAPVEEQTRVCHGFLRDPDGSVTTIDVPGADHTLPTSINGRGQIVGFYYISSRAHGFLLDESGFTTIDVSGAKHTFPRKIQGRRIVGEFVDAGGFTHGFLATP